MDKLKQIFSPGGNKDDEVLYGDQSQRSSSAATEQDTAKVHPVAGAKEHKSILSQITNPGGAKYDETRYGTTASTEVDPNRPITDAELGQKDNTISQQILNPGGAKYDEQRFGSTSGPSTSGPSTSGTAQHPAPSSVDNTIYETDPSEKKHEHSVLRQIFNPGGDKYDNEAYGSTARVVDNSSTGLTTGAAGTQSSTTGLGGASSTLGSQQGTARHDQTTSALTGVGQSNTTRQSLPDRTAPTTIQGESHLGRDATVAGTTGVVGGTTAYEASHPSTSTAHASHSYPESAATQTGRGYGTSSNPLGSSDTPTSNATNQIGSDSHVGRDAALAGSGVAGGAAAYETHQHSSNSSDPTHIIDRPHPLAGGSTHANPSQSTSGTLFGGSGSTTEEHDHHHLSGHGHDAAYAGVGAGAGALAGGAAAPHLRSAQHDGTSSDIIDRPHPLAGGSTLDSTDVPTSSPYSGTGSERGLHHSTGHENLGRDAGYTGAGALASGAAASQLGRTHHENTNPLQSGSGGLRQSETASSLSSPLHSESTGVAQSGSVPPPSTGAHPYEGYVHYTHGPHPTDIANLMDPHIPGEFPSEDGNDRHAGKGPARSSAATTGQGNLDHPISTTTNTLSSGPTSTSTSIGGPQGAIGDSKDHHYGRDAAIAGGGLVAAGVGAHELGTGNPGEASTTASAEPHAYDTLNKADSRVGPTATKDQKDHNREAVVVGGTGVAGLGAYETSEGRGDTGPASKTIGPHDSNILNVIDPRVQPDPAKMKDHTTTGPYQSDTLNKADPRVQSDPTKSSEKEHHYGRDAAVIGGTGAASIGAQEAWKRYEDTNPTSAATGKHDNHGHDTAAGAGAVYGGEQLAEDKHDKHHNKLQKARKEEAAQGGDHGEKKPSLLHRILHPGHSSKEQSIDEPTQKKLHEEEASNQWSTPHGVEVTRDQHLATTAPGVTSQGATSQGAESEGIKIEPHTGLPMNVGKYGSGAGGTDGAGQIEGYHEQDPATQHASIGTAASAGTQQGHHPGEEGVAGPDWEAIRKANTPY